MSPGKRRSHRGEIVATLRYEKQIAQFTNAQALLKEHLVHTREIPNGKDFMFLGPQEELHDALRLIVEIEHKSSRFFHIDFAQVDQYFLLRLIGLEKDQPIIVGYFDE